jgi:hypothetical protein
MTRRAISARPWSKDTEELIAYQEKRYKSFEYGRYGNPTTEACETKIRDLEARPYTSPVSAAWHESPFQLTQRLMCHDLTRVPFAAHLPPPSTKLKICTYLQPYTSLHCSSASSYHSRCITPTLKGAQIQLEGN